MRDERAKLRRVRFWLLAALLLALPLLGVLAPTMATAQDPTTAQKLDAIRARMEKGQGLFVGGDLAGAATVFDEGYQAHPYSAFLFNAGVCYQRLGNTDRALERFREYVRVDPTAPDVAQVRERIAKLEAAQAAAAAAAAPPPGAGGAAADAGAPPVDAGPPPPVDTGTTDSMKSLVVVDTRPPGAPLSVYQRTQPNAAAFQLGGTNPGWTLVVQSVSPANLTLDVGDYHLVVEKFQDFNESQADIHVTAGQVLHFQANLSQGAFMGYLRVSANVRGARIFIDDDQQRHPEWGVTPYGELVPGGKHTVLLSAPGYELARAEVEILHGETKQIELAMVRLGWGTLLIDANSPEVSVLVDDKPMGKWRSGEPPLEIKLQAGRKRLTLIADGRKTYEGVVDVPPGQSLPVHGKMVPTYPRGAAWTQAIIGGVVLGASIYFGLASNDLHDELEADRQAGVLESDDGRILRGQIYSIGADVGFVVGGVLGILATYNFIRDPLPESNQTTDKPVEFDDPLKTRPVEAAPGPPPAARRQPARRTARPGLRIGPVMGDHSGGLVLGGTF